MEKNYLIKRVEDNSYENCHSAIIEYFINIGRVFQNIRKLFLKNWRDGFINIGAQYQTINGYFHKTGSLFNNIDCFINIGGLAENWIMLIHIS